MLDRIPTTCGRDELGTRGQATAAEGDEMLVMLEGL